MGVTRKASCNNNGNMSMSTSPSVLTSHSPLQTSCPRCGYDCYTRIHLMSRSKQEAGREVKTQTCANGSTRLAKNV